MRGQIVVCKDVNGNPLQRRIWDFAQHGVFIHSEEEWEKRMQGERSLEPVGFPIEDVFQYNEKARSELAKSSKLDWNALTPIQRDATMTK